MTGGGKRKTEHPLGPGAAMQARLDKQAAGRPALDKAMQLINADRMESDRTMFENWIVTIRGERPDLERWNDGEYRVQDTRELYAAWVAGQHSPYRKSLKWFPVE